MTNRDQKFISYALNLAKQNLGRTAPNPVVSCVIVKDGEIISSGVTAKNGRPHAEKIAIEKVVDKAILKGSELYVTLEPCAHFGQTPPCCDEIIKYGFKRVVVAVVDCDERVNGLGIKRMREAGIEVVCGVLEKEAREINRGFFKARRTGLPFVTLKLATSLDGKIATKDFESKWITNERSRFFAHHLRSINDAILVGANTVRKDNPSLDCRIPGLEDFSPRKVVLSSTGSDPIALTEFLKNLCAEGVNSLLVEGGQSVATQFLQENLVDELVWIRSPKIIGNDGIAAVGDLGFVKISEILSRFSPVELREIDGDVLEILQKK